VITKAVPQSGGRVRGLVEYLFGPGRSEEHTDPHVIAAYDPILVGDRGDTPSAARCWRRSWTSPGRSCARR